ncbi:MAG TPA: hypothetical protein PLC42_04130 [Parachlamydiaceae bacterium]|nr:hypothetical protein [Parachlamydiaceae bacterium]
MISGQDPFSECRASFDLVTYYRKHPFFVREKHVLSCEEAKTFLKMLPQDRAFCSHRIENLNLQKPERFYSWKSQDTADMTVKKIDLFKENVLPEIEKDW